jgi:hypothetical protein
MASGVYGALPMRPQLFCMVACGTRILKQDFDARQITKYTKACLACNVALAILLLLHSNVYLFLWNVPWLLAAGKMSAPFPWRSAQAHGLELRVQAQASASNKTKRKHPCVEDKIIRVVFDQKKNVGPVGEGADGEAEM